MMHRLFFLNRLTWPIRLPVKWLLFALTVLVVCFPYPRRFVDHLRHWRDPNALIEPDAESLAPFVERLAPKMTSDLPPKQALKTVERFVIENVPYDWDWNTWGTADYLPTVTEVMNKGREDCDGRAVIAASLLRRFGFQSEIVTDFSHVWVKTEHGETMGPGKNKAVVATEEGLKLQRGALAELPKALAYGIGPFPLVRELIILVAMWFLLLRTGVGVAAGAVSLLLFVTGLLFLRYGGVSYLKPVVWMQVLGLVNGFGAFALLLFGGRRRSRPRGASPDAA